MCLQSVIYWCTVRWCLNYYSKIQKLYHARVREYFIGQEVVVKSPSGDVSYGQLVLLLTNWGQCNIKPVELPSGMIWKKHIDHIKTCYTVDVNRSNQNISNEYPTEHRMDSQPPQVSPNCSNVGTNRCYPSRVRCPPTRFFPSYVEHLKSRIL